MGNYKVWIQREHSSNEWFHSTSVEKHTFETLEKAVEFYLNVKVKFHTYISGENNGVTWEKVFWGCKAEKDDIVAIGRNW